MTVSERLEAKLAKFLDGLEDDERVIMSDLLFLASRPADDGEVSGFMWGFPVGTYQAQSSAARYDTASSTASNVQKKMHQTNTGVVGNIKG